MRILHTSDWHLGKSLVGKPRMKEQQEMLCRLFDVVREQRIDLLLVCGDIFDTSVPKAEAEELFFSELVRLSSLVPIVCIAGNHDDGDRLRAPGPVAVYSQIYLVGGMDNTSLSRGKVAGGDGWLRLFINGERLNLALLPYPFSSNMLAEVRAGAGVDVTAVVNEVAADIAKTAESDKDGLAANPEVTIAEAATGAKSIGEVAAALANGTEYEAHCDGKSEENAVGNISADTAKDGERAADKNTDGGSNLGEKKAKLTNEDRVGALIKRCCACFGEGVNIFASHLFITGSEVCEDRELGSAPLLSKSVLPDCDYVALGHIHKPQRLSRRRHIYYSGSPLPYSFDDSTDKFYFVFDSADNSVTKIPAPLGTRLVTAEVDSFEAAEKVLAENESAYVKLIYRGAPLSINEVRAIKSYECFTDIRFETAEVKTGAKTRADASPTELFKAFYLAQKGEEPDDELTDLFLAVLGDEYEL